MLLLFFYGIFALVAWACLALLTPYLGIIAFSLVMVIILKPVYDFFLRWMPRWKTLATLLTIVVFVIAVIVPTWIIIRISLGQVGAITSGIEIEDPTFDIDEIIDRTNWALAENPRTQDFQITDEQREQIRSGIQSAIAWVAGRAVNVGLSVTTFIINAFIFFCILLVLLPGYHEFARRLVHLSKIKSTVWSMFIGIFVIAVIQGLITGAFIWLAGAPYATLWTLIAVLTSVLPLGAFLIAGPVALFLVVTGNYTGALIIMGGYLLIVTNIDNVVRPWLVSEGAYLNFVWLLLGAVGGYELFGLLGVVYGPAIIVLLLTTIDVYEEFYLAEPEVDETTPHDETASQEVPAIAGAGDEPQLSGEAV
ncbi:AI-2E family transporter [Chloroflexi bacterium TSY]|nr:AI-2E family transporter [Chloroflexi bacterium TSY]